MGFPPRLGAVLCLHLLLSTSSAAHRPAPATNYRPLPAAEPTAAKNSAYYQTPLVRDCSDLAYGSPSGVYLILEDLQTPAPVYCDMSDGEGWTVFQRRANILPRQDFLLDWESYKWGFGTLDEEFWWGLHHLWRLTSQLDRIYELRVDLWDWDEQTRYATYQRFKIASEQDDYTLEFVDYAGDAGDGLDIHNGMKFSTIDRDNDKWSEGSCASDRTGAWWYNSCHNSNLNGVYSPGTETDGVVQWEPWRNNYSLNATTMKIRPTKKL